MNRTTNAESTGAFLLVCDAGLLAGMDRRSPVERQPRDLPGDPSEAQPIAWVGTTAAHS